MRPLALCLLALAAPALALESNRPKDNGAEPAANWIFVTAARGGTTLHFWCHAADCLWKTHAGATTGANKNEEKKRVITIDDSYEYQWYLHDAPLYTLRRVSDPAISMPTFVGLVSPFAATYEFDDSVSFMSHDYKVDAGYAEAPGAPKDGGWSVELSPDVHPADGSIVVLNDEKSEPVKPMFLSIAETGTPCAPAGIDEFYGSNAWKLNWDFAPTELQLEKARLASDATAVRVHSGQFDGKDWKYYAENAQQGNYKPGNVFATSLHGANRSVAQWYLRESGPDDYLTEFEQRYLHCLAGYADRSDKLTDRVLAAAAKEPAAFVKTARGLLKAEVKRFVDGGFPKGFPEAASVDWRADWSRIVSDVRKWADEDAVPADPAAAASQEPAVVGRPVEPAGKPGKTDKDPDELSEQMRKAIGDDK